MAFQSVWYYTDLPEDIVDIIERDVSETFDEQMGDSKLHGDALNKEKRNSQNAWIPTTHWVGGFLWHYIQRANRENFLYDLRCICLLYTSPSPRDLSTSRMPSSA